MKGCVVSSFLTAKHSKDLRKARKDKCGVNEYI
jgi:hypothetical protein